MRNALFSVVVSSCALLLSQGAMTASASPNKVNVVAKEFSYEMPDSIPAGPTLFHLTNAGNQLHHVTLIKLEDGKTFKDFMALPPGPFPAWVVFVGGPNTPLPMGGVSEDAVDLTAGNYAVVCVIPDTDGAPHMVKGMAKALTVTPTSGKGSMPDADITLTLSDYNFKFSKPLTPGKHKVKLINLAKQPHEAVIFKMNSGKTGEDMASWVETGMKGPPPGAPVTGISPMSPGVENVLNVDVSNGTYALLCFMPDAKDGKMHVAHGMIYNFKI